MEFNNRLVINNGNVIASTDASAYSSSSFCYWHINEDEELAPQDVNSVVSANSVLRIGDFMITATENGLMVTKKDGTSANIIASGEITAYGN